MPFNPLGQKSADTPKKDFMDLVTESLPLKRHQGFWTSPTLSRGPGLFRGVPRRIWGRMFSPRFVGGKFQSSKNRRCSKLDGLGRGKKLDFKLDFQCFRSKLELLQEADQGSRCGDLQLSKMGFLDHFGLSREAIHETEIQNIIYGSLMCFSDSVLEKIKPGLGSFSGGTWTGLSIRKWFQRRSRRI
jgi:hypothetical protein